MTVNSVHNALCDSIRGRILKEVGAYVMICGCGSLLSHSLMRSCLECISEEGRMGECPRDGPAGTISPIAFVTVVVCSSSLIIPSTHLVCDALFILCCEYNYVYDCVWSLQWFDCLLTKNNDFTRSPFCDLSRFASSFASFPESHFVQSLNSPPFASVLPSLSNLSPSTSRPPSSLSCRPLLIQRCSPTPTMSTRRSVDWIGWKLYCMSYSPALR
jgi:hypothetical protein